MQDLNNAINHLKTGKAPEPDNIPLELIACGGPKLKNHLMQLMLMICSTRAHPSDFRDANIVTIFKKGDRENCSNYRGFSLLSIASKIFARILNRFLEVAEEVLPESQSPTFTGTTDMIFCARQLQEKSQEQQQPLIFIFWYLKKAFNKVPGPAIWAVLACLVAQTIFLP